ncbi:LLM class flavin-dependent oxidoreductase [Streptomyces sp. NPDC002143]
MKIGVGLPSHVPGVRAQDVLAWARKAEQLGFDSLVVTDRFAYDQLEPLAVLAAVSSVTSRISLRTSILLAPARGSAGQLAKQLATLQLLSENRLTVGVGAGEQETDYRLAGVEYAGRHKRMEQMLTEMKSVWSGTDAERARIGPRVTDGAIPLMIGGRGQQTWRRVAEYADGWTMAMGTPDDFAAGAEAVRQSWKEHGRSGAPYLAAQRYFGLGAEGRAAAHAHLREYFRHFGPFVERLVQSAPGDAGGRRDDGTRLRDRGSRRAGFHPHGTRHRPARTPREGGAHLTGSDGCGHLRATGPDPVPRAYAGVAVAAGQGGILAERGTSLRVLSYRLVSDSVSPYASGSS